MDSERRMRRIPREQRIKSLHGLVSGEPCRILFNLVKCSWNFALVSCNSCSRQFDVKLRQQYVEVRSLISELQVPRELESNYRTYLFGGGETRTTLSPLTMMVPSFFVDSALLTSSASSSTRCMC